MNAKILQTYSEVSRGQLKPLPIASVLARRAISGEEMRPLQWAGKSIQIEHPRFENICKHFLRKRVRVSRIRICVKAAGQILQNLDFICGADDIGGNLLFMILMK